MGVTGVRHRGFRRYGHDEEEESQPFFLSFPLLLTSVCRPPDPHHPLSIPHIQASPIILHPDNHLRFHSILE